MSENKYSKFRLVKNRERKGGEIKFENRVKRRKCERQEEEMVKGNTGKKRWRRAEKRKKMRVLQKGETQDVGGRRRKMRDRCRELEAQRAPQCVCLSLSC